MLPRVRPYEPRSIESWPQEPFKSQLFMPPPKSLRNDVPYLATAYMEDGMQGDILREALMDAGHEDYALSYYDPFMGNVCATGNYVGLPIVATPSGPTGSELSIALAQHKESQQPSLNLLAPKSTLIEFISPICQIATPPSGSTVASDDNEQILVRTRESVMIVMPPVGVPTKLSRIQPDYVQVADEISTRPFSCKDKTIHAAICPYTSNLYALVGDRGRVALWTRPPTGSSSHGMDRNNDFNFGDDGGDSDGVIQHRRRRLKPATNPSSSYHADERGELGTSRKTYEDSCSISIVRKEDSSGQTSEDPWANCTWGASPSQLLVASRTGVDLLDCRSTVTQTSLFRPRTGETVRAIQEDRLSLAPFQTYIATSYQIACIDQRFTKRPVLSWAHNMGRAMPSGIKAMDLVSDGSGYTTVLAWDNRNADITAYNVSLGSHDREPEALSLMGRAQQLPSFHSHAHYTNTSSYRDPLKRRAYDTRPNGQLQQAMKPPLLGLAVLSSASLTGEHTVHSDDVSEEGMAEQLGCTKFSLLQYSLAGAVYAQDIELRTKQEVESMESDIPRDSILSADYHLGGGDVDIAADNILSSKLAQDLTLGQELDEIQAIDAMIKAAEGHVARWKREVKEAEALVDQPTGSVEEVWTHVELNLTSLLASIRTYLLTDREQNSKEVDIEEKADEAMAFIMAAKSSLSMHDVLCGIRCSNLPWKEREAISRQVQDAIEYSPYGTTDAGEIIHRRVIRRPLDAAAPQGIDQSLTKGLADLCIPSVNRLLDNGVDVQQEEASIEVSEENMGEPVGEELIWPSDEAYDIRTRTIQRVAQDMMLATTVVVRSLEPQESTTATNDAGLNTNQQSYSTFQYLFQDALSTETSPAAPKVTLSTRSRRIWDEWTVGEDPTSYVFRPLAATQGELNSSEEELDQEEQREREERLMALRRKREKRENKGSKARKNDPGYNINAGGSASQPVGMGIVVEDHDRPSFLTQFGTVDEDGMYSLPTIASASQIKARSGVQRPKAASSSLPVGKKSTGRPRASQTNVGNSGGSGRGGGGSSESLQRLSSLGIPLSMDRVKFQASFASEDASQKLWSTSVPSQSQQVDEVSASQIMDRDNLFSASQGLFSASQGWSQNESQSQESGGDFMWGASQPVRGAFANRTGVSTGVDSSAKKKKKKKNTNRSQGFL
ncbi:hypothetical protein BG011_005606 [Mortierella polycephala]|uniref:Uncharacterized protein n=1 Tax=Mortierella polycephala TaxID=41804 RepID=A0A9P6U136_9FUNG|nr:hypothetical protein BG011_005606 [Mortierella polycephala]